MSITIFITTMKDYYKDKGHNSVFTTIRLDNPDFNNYQCSLLKMYCLKGIKSSILELILVDFNHLYIKIWSFPLELYQKFR